MSEDLQLTFSPLEHFSEQTFAKKKSMFWTTLILKEEKKGGFPLLFAMAVLLPVSLSLGLYYSTCLSCLINMNDLQKLNQKVISFSVVKTSPVLERKPISQEKKKGWLNGSQKVERSLPTMYKQIKTAAMQRIPGKGIYVLTFIQSYILVTFR